MTWTDTNKAGNNQLLWTVDDEFVTCYFLLNEEKQHFKIYLYIFY